MNAWTAEWLGTNALLGVMHEGDLKPGGTRTTPAWTAGEGHRMIVGPTGSGKFWAGVCPLLLTLDASSAIVFDVAGGEAAQHTARWRSTLGPVLTLDPYRLQSDGAGALNPLDFLGADDGGLVTRARALADAVMMVQQTGGDSDYWNGQARDLLAALLIHIHTSELETDRTLGRIRDLIRGPLHPDPDKGITDHFGLPAMRANPAAGNFVRDAALNAMEDIDLTGGRNLFYVRQSLRENTAFLDAPEIRRVLSRTSLDLRQLREGVATLYIVSPAAELRALGRWMRLMYATMLPLMQAPSDAARHSAGNGVPLHIVMDEFAAFGPFIRVTDDMATVRKFGITYHLALQKLSQLQGLYQKTWETFIPRYLHVLGSDEQATSEYVSQRMGTVRLDQRSIGTNRGAMGAGGSSESISQYTARFREPHAISGMPAHSCYVVVQGSPRPLLLRKCWAFDDPLLVQRMNGIAKPTPIAATPRRLTDGTAGAYRLT